MSILVYLALRSQIDANEAIKTQFDEQQINNANDFEFSKYIERIYLIIREVESFNVSLYKRMLITSLSDLSQLGGKKHNFVGVQGLSLFLLEYFRDKKEKENNGTKVFDVKDSFHSIALGISNIVVLFHNTNANVKECSLSGAYKNELEELLSYVYVSKMTFLVEYYRKNTPSPEFAKILEELSKEYNKSALKE